MCTVHGRWVEREAEESSNEILNVIALHRKLGQHATSEEDVTIEDWNFPATHDDLERVLDGFHPSVKRVFLYASLAFLGHVCR